VTGVAAPRGPWTNCTALASSLNADAHRFVEPERASPAAKIDLGYPSRT
jgi:hypothetical protein